jgi:hypothetical protein
VPRVPPSQHHAPCPSCRGGKADHLLVDAPRSFHLALDRGRDLPVADSSGLLMPGAEFDLIGSHGDDSYDWKRWMSRCMSPQPVLIDLDYGGLQIGYDSVKHRGLGELCELIHSDSNVGT